MQFNNLSIMNKTMQKDPIKNTVIIFPIPLQQKQRIMINPSKVSTQIPLASPQEPLNSIDFYISQSTRLSIENINLISKLRKCLEEKRDIAQAIIQLEQFSRQEPEDKKKRVRRCASQIQRKFICPVSNCKKSYGTDSSMAQHLRLKHPTVQYDIKSFNQGTMPIKEEDKSIEGKFQQFQSGDQS